MTQLNKLSQYFDYLLFASIFVLGLLLTILCSIAFNKLSKCDSPKLKVNLNIGLCIGSGLMAFATSYILCIFNCGCQEKRNTLNIYMLPVVIIICIYSSVLSKSIMNESKNCNIDLGKFPTVIFGLSITVISLAFIYFLYLLFKRFKKSKTTKIKTDSNIEMTNLTGYQKNPTATTSISTDTPTDSSTTETPSLPKVDTSNDSSTTETPSLPKVDTSNDSSTTETPSLPKVDTSNDSPTTETPSLPKVDTSNDSSTTETPSLPKVDTSNDSSTTETPILPEVDTSNDSSTTETPILPKVDVLNTTNDSSTTETPILPEVDTSNDSSVNTIRPDCTPKGDLCKDPWQTYKQCVTRNKTGEGTDLFNLNNSYRQGQRLVNNKDQLNNAIGNLRKVPQQAPLPTTLPEDLPKQKALAFKFSHR